MSNGEAFIKKLYLQMYDFLLEYAKASLGSVSLAEEAVQDTFVIAWKKQDALSISDNPEGWLVNTLKNVISNTRKSQNSANQLLQAYLAVNRITDTEAESQLPFEMLYQDLAETEELKLIREMAVDGCSYLEMAERRGISMEACRKRVQRAKEFLRKKLSE